MNCEINKVDVCLFRQEIFPRIKTVVEVPHYRDVIISNIFQIKK